MRSPYSPLDLINGAMIETGSFAGGENVFKRWVDLPTLFSCDADSIIVMATQKNHSAPQNLIYGIANTYLNYLECLMEDPDVPPHYAHPDKPETIYVKLEDIMRFMAVCIGQHLSDETAMDAAKYMYNLVVLNTLGSSEEHIPEGYLKHDRMLSDMPARQILAIAREKVQSLPPRDNPAVDPRKFGAG